jgi:hypothetical protein
MFWLAGQTRLAAVADTIFTLSKSECTLPTMRKKLFWILDYVLAWGLNNLNLNVFPGFYLGMVPKPLGKLFAFVGVAGETFCLCIPPMTERAGNIGIVAHINHE